MKKLWISFAAVLVVSFSVLGWIGTPHFYQEMPPSPLVSSTPMAPSLWPYDGDIGRGQTVWQALGGMEVGSIWGHGSYVASDWTADWLHRESSFVLTEWSTNEYGKPYEQLSPEDQGRLRGRLEQIYRHNGYDHASNTIRIAPVRAARSNRLAHFSDKFEGQPRICDSVGQRVDSGAHEAVRRFHLLDSLVRCCRTAGRHRFLHQ